MTREEERKNEAKNRYPYIKGLPQTLAHQEIFIEGAKWSDENPNKKLVYTKKELRDMGFGFDLNGNIITLQEIEERTKKYINYRKTKWIEKACKYLESAIRPYMSSSATDDFVNDFRKIMEE